MENHYLFKSSDDHSSFEFISDGPNGRITKVVQFRKVPGEEYFNLSLSDKDLISGNLRDDTVTNNSDRQKVLATVAEAVRMFAEFHPGALVFATGNTRARTRLYRMGISNNLESIEHEFDIFGLVNLQWFPFEKGIEYDAFLVRCKLVILL